MYKVHYNSRFIHLFFPIFFYNLLKRWSFHHRSRRSRKLRSHHYILGKLILYSLSSLVRQFPGRQATGAHLPTYVHEYACMQFTCLEVHSWFAMLKPACRIGTEPRLVLDAFYLIPGYTAAVWCILRMNLLAWRDSVTNQNTHRRCNFERVGTHRA